jgi:hypothetical protein
VIAHLTPETRLAKGGDESWIAKEENLQVYVLGERERGGRETERERENS